MPHPSFNPTKTNLPIAEVIGDVQQKLAAENTLILNAPPGAGKSTIIPIALLEETWLEGKKILMLEPRRLAARSVAARMAELLEDELGNTVGYRIRFENKTNDNTRVEVLTEGILTRMLQSDNALEDIGLVIFDEFHERSIHADLALALCREAQQVLRPDLRIVIMSATLDMPALTELLQCPVVVSEGRQFPVEMYYVGQTDVRMMAELAAETIVKASKAHEGDILAFFPGQGEIKKCEEILRQQLPAFRVHPLYGALPHGKQFAAIMPDREGRRKVVLATSIAETSLTIEGIKVVVDTGFGRTSRFDTNSGLSRLQTVQIDKDSADQRAGRAGRLAPGVCYRMWTKATHARLAEHRKPEIEEVDLTSLVLTLAEWGITDMLQLTWLTPPPAGAMANARDTLSGLEALENGRITPHGKRLNQFACHPRIAHMLLCAKDHDLLALACDLAALLEERDPLPRETGIDINLRIEALRRHRRDGLRSRKMDRIEQVAHAYRRMFSATADNGAFDPYDTGLLLVHAYPERIASARPGNNAQFQLANGRLAMASHTDDLAYETWLAIANVDARDGMGKIFLAAPLNAKDLQPLVTEKEVITWDTKKGGLIADLQMRIGSIILKTIPLADPDETFLVQAICDFIKKEGEHTLPFTDDVTQWQNRVLSLRKWHPQDNWQDVSTPALLATAEEWLSPYLNNVRKSEDLRKLDLATILQYHLDQDKQQALKALAPTHMEVPSGSNIRLEYQANGSSPVLKVRLQEVFGLDKTPVINNGKTPVLMYLLSPGFKPVQITSDLESFWNNAYFDVKKDLKGRYPKHVWPDDPWNEPAIRGVKRKKKG